MTVFLAAAAAAVCMAGILNPHPHAIRDGDDAITTSMANHAATFPDMADPDPKSYAAHKSIYRARREGDLWHVIPHPYGGKLGEGCHYWIDARRGCTVKNICIN